MLVDSRERYKFSRHCERLLLWQINKVERERREINRILRKNWRRMLVDRALRTVVQANREYMSKIFLDSGLR